jgi:hypothetical protein
MLRVVRQSGESERKRERCEALVREWFSAVLLYAEVAQALQDFTRISVRSAVPRST